MFWKEPSICILVSASTILVFVTFSMVNFVLPPLPANLPTARDRWSPFICCLTSCISNDSTNRSSRRNNAKASSTSNPQMNAFTKSAAFWRYEMSGVSGAVLISTFLVFRLKRICSFRCSVTGVNIFNQFSFKGEYLCAGTDIWNKNNFLKLSSYINFCNILYYTILYHIITFLCSPPCTFLAFFLAGCCFTFPFIPLTIST